MRVLKWITRINPLLLAAGLFSCAGPLPSISVVHDETSSPGNPTKLTVCSSTSGGSITVLTYAVENKIFAKYGLDVTPVALDSGSRAVTALISGSAPLCQISGPAVIYGIVAGADLAIIGNLIDTYTYSLIVPASIESAADLKGKAVAVSAAGSAAEKAMRMALRILGLQPDRDVTLLEIGSQGDRTAAMEAGYVVGTLLTPPETVMAKKKGFHELFDMSTTGLPDLHSGMVTTRTFIKTNRETVLQFMKAMSESIFLIKNDKQAAIGLMSNLFRLDLEKDSSVLEETYRVFLKNRVLDIPVPSLDGVESILAEVKKEDPRARQLKSEQMVDRSIIAELEENGFFRDLWGSNHSANGRVMQ
jgi:NitT/TauT family transport system substrate-binding protein